MLMRGFPDDHHIYDRLARLLAPRHVLAFDWLATVDRASAKLGHSTESRRQQDLNAVIDLLGLEKVVLVGRDASADGHEMRPRAVLPRGRTR